MKKILFATLFLVACGKGGQNIAELRVKSDVPDAKCASGTLSDGTSVTKCTIKSDDGKTTSTLVAAQGDNFPFQAWPYKSTTQLKEERKAAEKSQEEASKSPPSTGSGAAPTGTGSGSGTASTGSGSGSAK